MRARALLTIVLPVVWVTAAAFWCAVALREARPVFASAAAPAKLASDAGPARPGVRPQVTEPPRPQPSTTPGPSVEPAPAPAAEPTHRLSLRFYDDRTGAPVAARIELWRLGLPATADRTAGDEVWREVDVPAEGTTLERLPAGRYRAAVADLRLGAEDPPEIVLCTDATRVLPCALPRNVHVLVDVRDERGAALTTARAGLAGRSSHGGQSRDDPRWARRRVPHDAGPLGGRMRGRGSTYTCGRSRLAEVTAGPRGFAVGTIRESSECSGSRFSAHVVPDGRNSVRVRADSDVIGDGEHVAVAVPLARLVEHVRLPDGRGVLEAGGAVVAESDAWRKTALTAPSAWRSIPISVSVRVPGYEWLLFEWQLDEPPRATVVLRPRDS